MSAAAELLRDSAYSAIVHLAPRVANVLVFILVGRLAGPAEAGAFNLALTYLILFTTVMRGLDDLVVRQVAREPEKGGGYLTSFLAVRAALSIPLYGILTFIVRVVLDYPDQTAIVILVLTLSLMPDSLSLVALSTLLGRRRFSPPAFVLGATSAFKIIGGGGVVLLGGDLLTVAWTWLLGSVLGMIAMLVIAFRNLRGSEPIKWRDWSALSASWRAALPFLLITTLMTLEGQSDTVFLSAFRDETEVGWYGAATTVAFSLAMLSQAYRMSVYPLMARFQMESGAPLQRLYSASMRLLGTMIFPMVAGIALLAPGIVSLVFGPDFAPAAPVLQLLIPAMIFIFLNVPLSRMMLTHDRQGRISVYLSAGLLTNIGLNLALDPLWGARGAAVARVSSTTLYFLLNYAYVSRFLARSNPLRRLIKPGLATLIMSGAVWFTRGGPILLPIGVGILVYFLALWSLGGITPEDVAIARNVWSGRERQPLSEKTH
jgi:O-antigen/teichoic acid export membrane protein